MAGLPEILQGIRRPKDRLAVVVAILYVNVDTLPTSTEDAQIIDAINKWKSQIHTMMDYLEKQKAINSPNQKEKS
jgi:hypothetical protein